MKIRMTLTMLLVAMLSASVHGQSSPGTSDARDRAAYNRLVGDIQSVDRERDQVEAQAFRSAKANGGEADPELQARMLALRDRRDRLWGRLTVMTGRHPDWPMPELNELGARSEVPDMPTPRERIFAPVTTVIRERFAQEALEIAATVRLPVVSCRSLLPTPRVEFELTSAKAGDGGAP